MLQCGAWRKRVVLCNAFEKPCVWVLVGGHLAFARAKLQFHLVSCSSVGASRVGSELSSEPAHQ